MNRLHYSDQHIHCSCSFDSHASLEDMVHAAHSGGISMLCFTDHMDMGDGLTGAPFAHPAERQLSRFAERRAAREQALSEGIEVRLGMELGEPLDNVGDALLAASSDGLDLVIASLHHLPDTPDFYFLKYESEAHCEALNRRYLAELIRMADFPDFDILGHIGYTTRYMQKQGFSERITADKYGDELETLLRRLIDRGRGIECNGSGYRDGGTFPFPDADILKLYRSLGGEIVTVGSDSHDTASASAGYCQRAYALLRACGFRAVCEFRNRQPVFVDI